MRIATNRPTSGGRGRSVPGIREAAVVLCMLGLVAAVPIGCVEAERPGPTARPAPPSATAEVAEAEANVAGAPGAAAEAEVAEAPSSALAAAPLQQAPADRFVLGRPRQLDVLSDAAAPAAEAREYVALKMEAAQGPAPAGAVPAAAPLGGDTLSTALAAGESYARIDDNPFIRAAQQPLSTFSVDVDTASYANVRRFLRAQNMLPPPDAVRVEELVNYFVYEDEPPSAGDPHPFAVSVEVARCPWAADHRIARIGVKGREVERDARSQSNLVFLLDVSGSMDSPDKLPLLKRAMQLLVDELGEGDRVAIVVYASAEGLALPSTRCDRKEEIRSALESLQAGGSTAGGAGIGLAYEVAAANFIEGGINRVILCTDGDFNVGISDEGQLTRLIEDKARSGVFLSVLGFGTGNYQDAKMEALADRGNGNYAYIDSLAEARKVLVEQMGGTLVTIAKDVKIQVDFNPARVGAYRLIGYENRLLAAEDFEDDAKDAGEIGAGHAVTALYELVPPGAADSVRSAPESRYVAPPAPAEGRAPSDELMTVSLRSKAPDGDTSTPMSVPVTDGGLDFADASDDLRFSSAVAAFGMLLRGSPHVGTASYDAVLELAQGALGDDPGGYRAEFLDLVRAARDLSRANP